VEFAGGSGPVALVGGGPAVARGDREASATQHDRESESSCGSEAAAHRAWQAGPAVEWPSIVLGSQSW
jgi:hypothetical protein